MYAVLYHSMVEEPNESRVSSDDLSSSALDPALLFLAGMVKQALDDYHFYKYIRKRASDRRIKDQEQQSKRLRAAHRIAIEAKRFLYSEDDGVVLWIKALNLKIERDYFLRLVEENYQKDNFQKRHTYCNTNRIRDKVVQLF